MAFKFYLSFLMFVVVQQPLYAQNTSYQFSHLDITNGLSVNQVSCVFKDSNGFMWFGTLSGLNRYDGYKFKVFKHSASDPNSINDNIIKGIFEGPDKKLWIKTHYSLSVYNPVTEKFSNDIAHELRKYNILTDQLVMIRKDRQGNFWFLTNNEGLYCYHPKTNTTTYLSDSDKSAALLHSSNVTDVVEDSNNFIWLIYADGIIDKFDIRANKVIYRSNRLVQSTNKTPEGFYATFDNKDNLWLFAKASSSGVFRYNIKSDVINHFSTDFGDLRLNSNVINDIIIGDDNKIWIGTDNGGINLIDPVNNSVQYLVKKEDDPKSLRGNNVVLYKDNTGIIWAATYKQGISYYHKSLIQFPLIRNYLSDNKSLPYEDVDCFADDAKGNLWIGTNGGGLIYYNASNGKYTTFKHSPKDLNTLSNDIIISICIDHEHKLWIGTYFGGLDCFDGGKFTHYKHNDNIPSSISDDRVYSIIEDSSQKLWVGTFAGGMNIFDRGSKSFLHPNYRMVSNYTAIIYEDRNKNI